MASSRLVFPLPLFPVITVVPPGSGSNGCSDNVPEIGYGQ